MKNKAHVESSICNAYLTEEASHFVSHYFGPEVRCRSRDLPPNDDGGFTNDRSGVLSIFTHPIRFHGKGKKKVLSDTDIKIAHRYVLMNCPELAPFVNQFIAELRPKYQSMPREQFDAMIEEEFPKFFQLYVSLYVTSYLII